MKLPLRVDLNMKLSEVAGAIDARVSGSSIVSITGVALDTRAIRKGDLFFALRATRDGPDVE